MLVLIQQPSHAFHDNLVHKIMCLGVCQIGWFQFYASKVFIHVDFVDKLDGCHRLHI